MSLTDYLPGVGSIGDLVTAPFKSRDGHPWLQSTARNMGHAAFGDKIGNYVDQNLLGDPAPGATGPAPVMPAAAAPQNTQIQQLIQAWLAQGKQPSKLS